MGKAKNKSKISQIFSQAPEINRLSAARVFLFGARDVWFVVGVPVFLHGILGWSFGEVGAFMACWVIAYGFVQAIAPKLTKRSVDGKSTEVKAALMWVCFLGLTPLAIVAAMNAGWPPGWVLVGGLGVFGFVFAVNSAVHSYLILAFSEHDGVAVNVGFYYMANAAGRLLGTLTSGAAYQWGGIEGCLLAAFVYLALAAVFTVALKRVV